MIRFAILYFTMLVIFIVLLAAPLIVKRMGYDQKINKSLWGVIGVSDKVSSNTMFLLQPIDHGLNDTATYYTGASLPAGKQAESSVGNPTASGTWGQFKLI